jgi:hypothetical protein
LLTRAVLSRLNEGDWFLLKVGYGFHY